MEPENKLNGFSGPKKKRSLAEMGAKLRSFDSQHVILVYFAVDEDVAWNRQLSDQCQHKNT